MESSRPVSRLERRDIAGSAKDFLRFTDEDVEYIELDLLRCPPMIARQSTLPYAVMAAAKPKVELVYDPDCPNVEHARVRLREAIAEDGRGLQWTEWASDNPALPDHARGYASPTILINQRDVAPNPTRATACRLYDQGNGTLHPAPPASAITAALRLRSR